MSVAAGQIINLQAGKFLAGHDLTLITGLTEGRLLGANGVRTKGSIKLESGKSIWVAGNATEHIVEYAKMKAINYTPEAVNMASQEQLTSLYFAIEKAAVKGLEYDKMIHVGGWELIFSKPRAQGQLPVLKHALYK